MITDRELSKALRTMKILFFSIFSSLFVYLFVAYMLGNSTKTAGDPGMLRPALYAVSCIILLITKPVKKKILSKGAAGAKQTGPFQYPEIQRYMTAMINSCALTESIGVFGLVLFLVGRSTTDLYILIIVSAIAMLQHRPKEEELRGLFKVSTLPGTEPV